MMMIRFHCPHEFLSELLKERSHIRDSVVRLTTRRQTDAYWIRWSVVGTANLGDDTLVRLDAAIGIAFGYDEESHKGLCHKANKCRAELEDKLAALGLEIRPGVLEPCSVSSDLKETA